MTLLENKKLRHDYEVIETYTAGIVLTGGEVKSLRQKSGSFTGSYVKILHGEAFLLNCQITPYKFADNTDYDPKRTRKLLLKRREIEHFQEALEKKGISLIPLAFFLGGRNVKLQLALARGKKQFEQRAMLKKRAIERDIQREMKNKVRVR
jgi:SsrA-binding protein